jgi:hypothetical protein
MHTVANSRWRYPRHRAGGIVVVICSVVIAGCASSEPVKSSAAAAPPAHPSVVRVPARSLELQGAGAPLRLALDVREAGPGDTEVLEALRREDQRFSLLGLGVGGIGLWDALTFGGTFAGAEVLGAIVILPTMTILSAVNARARDTVNRALKETPVGPLVRTDLEAAARPKDSADSGAPTAEVTVLVTYGLVPRDKVELGDLSVLCLLARAVLKVSVDGRNVFEDTIHVEPYLRSSDAPPPVCATLSDFAVGDGRLVKRGLTDEAQVLAAIVIRRTRTLPWNESQPPH